MYLERNVYQIQVFFRMLLQRITPAPDWQGWHDQWQKKLLDENSFQILAGAQCWGQTTKSMYIRVVHGDINFGILIVPLNFLSLMDLYRPYWTKFSIENGPFLLTKAHCCSIFLLAWSLEEKAVADLHDTKWTFCFCFNIITHWTVYRIP